MPPLLSRFHVLRNPNYTYPILIVTLTALATRTFLLEPHPVAGPSMAPALNPSHNRDTILVLKRHPLRPWEPTRTGVQRGDVVVFWKPGAPEEMGVKRVLGVEGDMVYRDFRRVGKRREGVVGSFGDRLGMGEVGTVVKVPIGHVWVEGDNWRESLDSNDFGPISLNLVTGKAVGIVWPFRRFGAIPDRRKEGASRTIVHPGEAFLPHEWSEW